MVDMAQLSDGSYVPGVDVEYAMEEQRHMASDVAVALMLSYNAPEGHTLTEVAQSVRGVPAEGVETVEKVLEEHGLHTISEVAVAATA